MNLIFINWKSREFELDMMMNKLKIRVLACSDIKLVFVLTLN